MEFSGSYDSDAKFRQAILEYVRRFGPTGDMVLWGVGKSCGILLDCIQATHRIPCLVDSRSELWGQTFRGYEIRAPNALMDLDHRHLKLMILPFGIARHEIADQLRAMGFDNRQFCFGNEYLSLHQFYHHDHLVFQNIGFFIGSACSLRCRDCIAHLADYRKNRNVFVPYHRVKEDIDQAFAEINFINLITLSTGEIFLHPELDRILEHLWTYRHRYHYVQTPTNGTILPRPSTLEIMHKCGVGLYVSDYSHEIGSRSKIPQLIALCRQHDIVCESFTTLQGGRAEVPTWSDVGPVTAVRLRHVEQTARVFRGCANRQAQVVCNGRLYTCGSAMWGEFGGLYEPKEGADYAPFSAGKLALLRAWLGATASGFPSVCERCDGIGPAVNTKIVRAGIQVGPSSSGSGTC